MKRPVKIILALLLPALFGWGIGALLIRDPSKPNRELFTEMSYSVAGESQGENSALPGNQVSRMPPEGTIYRGELVDGMAWDESTSTLAFSTDPEAHKKIALPKDEASEAYFARVGSKRYQKYCQSCHGEKGGGNASLSAAGFPKPPNIIAGRTNTMSDGEIFALISKGQGNMQPMGGRVPAKDIWAIIHHIRQAQGKGGK